MNISKFLVAAKLFRTCLRSYQKFPMPTPLCLTPHPHKLIVTLMDSTTTMGQALALMLKQHQMIKVLRLYDDKETFGIAMDLSDIDTSVRIASYSGEDNLKEALMGSDLVITCSGYSQNPFDSYEDLFERNADDTRRTAIYLTEFNRDAVLCITRPPIESLVPLVYQEYKKAGVKLPEVKIIGMANYTCMRANHVIAKILKVNPFHVTCPIIGGVSPETGIAVISGSNPGKRIASPRVLAAIQENMAYGEEHLLSIKINEEGGAVAYAPAVCAYRLVDTILRGMRGEHNTYDCAFVRQEGHLKKFLPYMTSIIKFGKYGVHTTHMPDITGGEVYRLKDAYQILKAYINLGESYVNGLPIPSPKVICTKPCEIATTKIVEDATNPLKVKIIDPRSGVDRCKLLSQGEDLGKPCNTC